MNKRRWILVLVLICGGLGALAVAQTISLDSPTTFPVDI